ncbi:MAG: PaaI family thioesterase [Armatimonadetes bacterium]|nr:PaaI family thioesterase [Anaerolineae bacterium]
METLFPALQDLCAPDGVCFGCGTANPDGLQLKSYWSTEDPQHIVATFTPKPQFMGYAGWVYGGLLASLIDCHSNWTAMAHHYQAEGRAPGTLPRIVCVTGSLGVKYIKPTPMDTPLHLVAWVEGEIARKTRILCEVYAGAVLTAAGDSVFVRVDPEQFR